MVTSQTHKQDEAVLSFVVSIIGIWGGGTFVSTVSLLRRSPSAVDVKANLPVDIFSHMGRKWRL